MKVLPVCFFFASVVSLPAAIAVQYLNTGDIYDTGDEQPEQASSSLVQSDLDADTFADDVTGYLDDQAFSTSTALGATSATGYNGPSIYGGVRIQRLDATSANFATRELANLSLRAQSSDTRLHSSIFFKTSIATTLDATSWMGFSTDSSGTPDGLNRLENLDGRFMLWDGSAFYISSTALSDNADGRILDGMELASEMWAVYDPSSDINFDLSSSFTTTTAAISAIGINGYGVYAENDAFSVSRHWLEFNTFTADAVVPEPSSVLTFFLGSLMLLRLRVRR